MLVEACRDLGRFNGDAGIEIVQVIAHRAGNVLRALAQTFDHFAAIGLYRAVELGEVAGNEIAERGGVAGDAFRKLGAAVVEHVFERLQPCSQHFAHGIAAAGDRVGELACALIEHVLERLQPCGHHFARRIAAAGNRVGKRLGALAELVGHAVAALHDGVGNAHAGLLELGHNVSAAQA